MNENTNIVRGRSLLFAAASFMLRFAGIFVLNTDNISKPLDEWTAIVMGSIEWIATILLIIGVVIAFIDDMKYNTYAHLLSFLIMSIVINSLLIVLVNVSTGIFIGVLIAFVAFTAFEMSVGGPFTALIGMLLSALGVLAPIIIFLIAIGSVFGLGMVF